MYSKSKISDFIKRQDKFGYPIMMNHNSESTFNTMPGGFMSTILNFFLVWITYQQLATMFTYGNNQNTANETMTQFSKIGTVQMKDYIF